MPEHTCQTCGAHYFGWSPNDKCEKCGGKLVAVDAEKWEGRKS